MNWAERKLPLHWGPPQEVSLELDVKLPANLPLRSWPSSFDITDPCFKARGVWSKKGDGLAFTLTMQRTCVTVDVADYPRVWAAANQIKQKLREEIVVGGSSKQPGKPDPKRDPKREAPIKRAALER